MDKTCFTIISSRIYTLQTSLGPSVSLVAFQKKEFLKVKYKKLDSSNVHSNVIIEKVCRAITESQLILYKKKGYKCVQM